MIGGSDKKAFLSYLLQSRVARYLLLHILSVTSLLFAITPLDAATFDRRLLKDGSVEVTLNGEIQLGDAMRLAEYIDDIQNKNLRVVSISLNSKGGIIYEGYLLATLIRLASAETVVREKSVCYSACFIAFISAKRKYAFFKAKIGVHSASDVDGEESDGSAVATLTMVRVAKVLGASDAVLGKMAKTPPNKIEILSLNDLSDMGVEIYGNRVVVTAPACQDPICDMLNEIFPQ